jgi:hypothetical protein
LITVALDGDVSLPRTSFRGGLRFHEYPARADDRVIDVSPVVFNVMENALVIQIV